MVASNAIAFDPLVGASAMTLLEQNALRDYAERRAKVRPDHRARNRLTVAVIVIVLAAVAGYFWRML